MAPASLAPSPHARRLDTETGLRFQDKMSLPLSAVAQRTGWSVPGRTMQRFSPQPLRPAPRGSSTEEMAARGWGSGPRGAAGAGSTGTAETSRRPLALGVTSYHGQPPPALALPRPQGLRPHEQLSLWITVAVDTAVPCSRRSRTAGVLSRGTFWDNGILDFSRWDLLEMMDFSRRMSRSDLAAGLGGSRARASPCTQGKDRAVETGISGCCWLRLSLGVFETRAAAIPGDRTQWVWGRLLAVLEAGAPSATAQPGAGSRRVSKCVRKRKEKKNTQAQTPKRKEKKITSAITCLSCVPSAQTRDVPSGSGFPRFRKS